MINIQFYMKYRYELDLLHTDIEVLTKFITPGLSQFLLTTGLLK